MVINGVIGQIIKDKHDQLKTHSRLKENPNEGILLMHGMWTVRWYGIAKMTRYVSILRG